MLVVSAFSEDLLYGAHNDKLFVFVTGEFSLALYERLAVHPSSMLDRLSREDENDAHIKMWYKYLRVSCPMWPCSPCMDV